MVAALVEAAAAVATEALMVGTMAEACWVAAGAQLVAVG